jgi:hypothetical protein
MFSLRNILSVHILALLLFSVDEARVHYLGDSYVEGGGK